MIGHLYDVETLYYIADLYQGFGIDISSPGKIRASIKGLLKNKDSKDLIEKIIDLIGDSEDD